jgi:hypothetical protein
MLFSTDMGRFDFVTLCSDRFANISGDMLDACLKTYIEDNDKKFFVLMLINKIISINIDDYINCLKVHKTKEGKQSFIVNAKKKLTIDRLEFNGLRECFSKDDCDDDPVYYICVHNFIEAYLSDGKIINMSELFKSIDDLNEQHKFIFALNFSKNVIIDNDTVITQYIKNEKLAIKLREYYNNVQKTLKKIVEK